MVVLDGPKLPPVAEKPIAVNTDPQPLIKMLNAPKYTEREAAEDALVAKGQPIVPKLTDALTSDSAEVTARVTHILSVLGWYVTRAGKVEKMSESKEFQEMMRKRLPEMPAE